VFPQHEIDVRDECLPPPLVTCARCVDHFLEVDRGLEWRGGQFAEADVLYDDVDLVSRAIHEERLDAAALIVLGDGGVGQGGFEEQQRVGVFPLDRRANPAEMLHDELRQEVAELRRLRLVARGVVIDGLRPANLIDPNHQRLHVGVPRGCVEIEAQQTKATRETRTSAIFK
jgi:hypothetical protein